MAIVVVADNCTDRTAELAITEGAECIKRSDQARPGKPRAIEWALNRLDLVQYDAVAIVDADAIVSRGFVAALAARAPVCDRVMQGYNDVSNPTDNSLTRLAGLFSAMRFRFMNALKQRAGLNSPLANGMCIGAQVLNRHGWRAFSLSEDWELYAIYTARGVRIDNVPSARLYAQEAASLRQSYSQRRRWTAGRLAVLARHGWALLTSGRINIWQKLDAIAELSAPGPAAHLGIAATLIAFVALSWPPGSVCLLVVLAVPLARLLCYTVAALSVDPQPARAGGALAILPFYAVWSLVVQFSSLAMLGGKPWVKTSRNPPT
jgi:cellulose synthase/poly-beta-1,6-N-acetylglucosamine synthase-like glycosyltransferase